MEWVEELCIPDIDMEDYDDHEKLSTCYLSFSMIKT